MPSAVRPQMNDSAEQPVPVRAGLLAGGGGAMLWAALATLGVELGTYFLCRWTGAEARDSLLSTLAAATVWVAISTAPLAAGAPFAPGAKCAPARGTFTD